MQWLNLSLQSLQWTLPLLAFMSGLFSLLLWIHIKQKKTALLFPIVKILSRSRVFRRNLKRKTPPLVPFICFLLVLSALIFVLSKPSLKVKRQNSLSQSTHIFVDLSPSLAARVSVDEYLSKIKELYSAIAMPQKISLSTSHSWQTSTINSFEDITQIISSLGFHNAGVRLGPAISALWKKMEKPDELIIVSDLDAHSWLGFDWNFLIHETKLWHFPIENKLKASQNFFVKESHQRSNSAGMISRWDILLSRSGEFKESGGLLGAYFEDILLDEVEWKFDNSQDEQMLRISWPSDLLENKQSIDSTITWVIKPHMSDSLDLDNQYKTRKSESLARVLLVSDPGGERQLEAPAHSLKTSFRALGTELKVYDWLNHSDESFDEYALRILFVGGDFDQKNECPVSLRTGIHQQVKEPQKELHDHRSNWIVPYSLKSNDLQDMCWCFARLSQNQIPSDHMPPYCKQIAQRKDLIAVFQSLGAKQIGGDVNEINSSLGWRIHDQKEDISTLAFTAPLKPDRSIGLFHSQIPGLVKSLIRETGLPTGIEPSRQGRLPRTDDISKTSSWTDQSQSLSLKKTNPKLDLSKTQFSNVSLQESLLKIQESETLPPIWPASDTSVPRKNLHVQEENNPLPFISICAWMILAGLLIELLWLLKKDVNKINNLASLLVTIFLLSSPTRSEASPTINLLGQFKRQEAQTLSREVSARTSIEMSQTLIWHKDLVGPTLQEPWLWASKPLDLIKSGTGTLDPQVSIWVRRGGFMVVEQSSDLKSLEKMTAKGFDLLAKKGTWTVIPPDHELMRSFYLLSSLPDCSKLPWHGFTYDDRLAILAIPHAFIGQLLDPPVADVCRTDFNKENYIRTFVNILMVALTTDYKKDQIHMKEILKRIR